MGLLIVAVCLPQKVQAKDALGITAEAYLLMEATTGRTLLAKNEQEHLPIASTTKILTALLALEQPETNRYFTVDPTAIKVEGSSMGLREGDQASLYTLAVGMLLSSGNDAANAAAVEIAGSISAFAERMNAKAAELGMTDSHFVTPSGLHDEEHYSTAADMATLARAALQNEQFVSICSQSRMQLSFGNPPFDRWLKNHNRLLTEYSGCIGMKTGYTKKAGRCLVSAAERNGVTLICVTLNAPNDWRDHSRLLDYGFSQVEPSSYRPDLSDLTLPVVGGVEKAIPVEALTAISTCAAEEDAEPLRREVVLPAFVYAPVAAGDVVGEARYYYKDFFVGSTPILAAESVDYYNPPPKTGFLEKLRQFFEAHFR